MCEAFVRSQCDTAVQRSAAKEVHVEDPGAASLCMLVIGLWCFFQASEPFF